MSEQVPMADRARSLGQDEALPVPGSPLRRVRVVTDSAADLDAGVALQHGIGIVRLDVRLGEYGPEVTSGWSPEQFWEMCAKVPQLAETSAPSPSCSALCGS